MKSGLSKVDCLRMTWVAALIFSLAVCVKAQVSSGTILGVVKDSSGAVVPAVIVTVHNVDNGQVRTVTSGADGSYRVDAVPVGRYDVRAERSGFRPELQTGLPLDVSQSLVVNFTLQVGSAAQEVTVTGEAPLVDTASGSLGGLVNDTKIADLPLNGRNYIDLTMLQAGVTLHQNHATGDVGTWFSTNGAPPWSNNTRIDGASMMTSAGGTSSAIEGSTLGVDGIQEYRVITGTYGAEFGGSMGSQIVIVSKEGTNQFHGDAFDYLRNSVLDARNFFDYGYLQPGAPRLPELQRNNFGGSIGGPIRKDKTFFYAVFEGLTQKSGVTAVDTVMPAACHTSNNIVDNKSCFGPTAAAGTTPVAPVMQPILALYPLPNLPNNQFTFPTANLPSDDYGQIRVDQTFSASDTFFSRYTIDSGYFNNAVGPTLFTGVAFPQFRTFGSSRNQYLSFGENHIFSPTLLNTVRLSFSRTVWGGNNLYPNGPPIGPGLSFRPGAPFGDITITGLSLFGSGTEGGGGEPSNFNLQNIYALSDDLNRNVGKHALKFGVLINRYNEATSLDANPDGTIAFSSLTNFIKGVPINYSGQISGQNINVFYTFSSLGFYAQDDWRATSRLTLNLGVRYEFITTPWELNGQQYRFTNFAGGQATPTQGPVIDNPSLHNFVPRIGFAYDVTGKGKTAIRGGFGIYDDVGDIGAILLGPGIPPLLINGSVINTQNQVLTTPLTFPPSSVGNTLSAHPDYGIKQPHALEYSLTIEQQLPGSIGLGVSYVGLRGLDLFQVKEGNPTIPVSVTNGIPFYGPKVAACSNVLPSCRVNPNWLATRLVTTAGDSYYNSLQITVNRRLSKGLEFQTSFTWSKSLDDTEGQTNASDCFTTTGQVTGVSPSFEKIDKGPSCFDATDVLRFNLLYHFPNVQSNSFAAKILQGWWMGNIVAVQSGYAQSPIITANRSDSGVGGAGADRPNINTAASIAATFPSTCTSLPGQAPAGSNPCLYTPIPFNHNTVNTGNFKEWFNPAMFSLQPVGYLGNAGRDMLRGPGLEEWDFSLVKDTALHLLGENGSIQFRAEMFNILNHANFGVASSVMFAGSVTDAGPYSELPNASAGQIASTGTTSRQIQLALKLVF